jgi:hypothetical protein
MQAMFTDCMIIQQAGMYFTNTAQSITVIVVAQSNGRYS